MFAMFQNFTLAAKPFMESKMYYVIVVGGLAVVVIGLIIYKRRQS
jgi:hypothetical protein